MLNSPRLQNFATQIGNGGALQPTPLLALKEYSHAMIIICQLNVSWLSKKILKSAT
jgi:hypothetical protein